MSELKAYIAPTPDGTGLADYYLKSEADKVIAELNQKLDDYRYTIAVLRKEKSCHKFKRCLAMAKWCATERDIYHLIPRFGKMKFYTKWRKRWLELAEKFKEAK